MGRRVVTKIYIKSDGLTVCLDLMDLLVTEIKEVQASLGMIQEGMISSNSSSWGYQLTLKDYNRFKNKGKNEKGYKII